MTLQSLKQLCELDLIVSARRGKDHREYNRDNYHYHRNTGVSTSLELKNSNIVTSDLECEDCSFEIKE